MDAVPGRGRITMAIAAVGAAALLAACGGSSSSSGSSTGGASAGGGGYGAYGGGGATSAASTPAAPALTIAGVQATNQGAATASGATLAVEVGDSYFKPTVISGTPGSKLTLTLTDTGQASHTFTMPSQGINVSLNAGDVKTVTVKLPASGILTPFWCTYHKNSGMVGGLKGS